ncbi:transcription elongation factor GreB [Alcanivorax sp. JB21]|uniref:transcription elongation factor GreB n=1 Tax=Alcanivorax limicola TaxID=2874102 RepID=UPI001CBADF6D|nr:transcription elongation factor GreB [Alcanivorax limicola]MBZ2190342.1 transcription elongation factor GreB [Alcanivorax limicola]
MGRWRPPARPASKYITPAGYRAMNEELQHLWKVKRPAVTQSVQEAAAQGDRSENAEYIYGKKMLREIDSRIRFLSRRLDDMVVVDQLPDDQSRVFFGAWVTVEDEQGEPLVMRLVGPDETDARQHWISVDSPMARAMLGKRVGDEVVVQTPAGERCYDLIDIRYQAQGSQT